MKKTSTQFFYAILCIIGLLSTTQSMAQQPNDSRILLQGFYWDCYQGNEGEWYNIIANNADQIANSGIDMIWLPAPSASTGGMGYLPTELNVLSNSFGTESEHKSMLDKLNSLGIEPIADIVINHRNGTSDWADFTNPEWDGTRSIVNNDEVWNEPGYGDLPRGGDDTGEGYDAGRDVDHTNSIVRQGIKDWLQLLKNAGYKGWRYDLVKGYAPSYNAEYNDASSPSFSVGEFYDFDKQKVQDWVDGTNKKSTAFDFPTYSTIKDAVKDNNYSYLEYEGGASGLIGWSPAQSTTFIENHDTPRYDSGRDIWNSNNVCIGYAYLLTHPGTPTIYWPHYFDWGVKDQINELIAVRKAAGVTNSSTLDIVKSQSDCYAAIVNGNVAVKLGSGDWSPGSEFTLQTSGDNYAVWANITESNIPVLTVTDGGNYSQGSVNITMSATNNGTIYYTLDGTEPSTSSILYTQSFVLDTPSTIKSIAYNNDGSSEVITNTYTFNEQTSITVLWKTDVSNPRLWFWGITDEGTNETYEWPGATMTSSTNNPGWVEYTINGSGGNFIFSDNGSNQTEDLVNITDSDSNSADGLIWYDNGWTDGNGSTTPIVNAPTITPNGAIFSVDTTVILSADNGASIYYTLDGSTPSNSSSQYVNAITVDKTLTLKSIAIKDNTYSKVSSATFTKTSNKIDKPIISPNGGIFDTNITVSITCNTGEKIYYTTDGTIPSETSQVYSSALSLTESTTVKAIAELNGDISEVVSASFTKQGESTANTDYFTWDNANVYFVMTDRFYNGNTSNDTSYGRGLNGNGQEYPDDSNSGAGEFHGGDLKGMTAKLKEGYFEEIGINAIWITSPVEQMHGWCGGGPAGDFRHYGYHGYYALDWSELDKNMGTEADLMEFVDEAHSRGIRIVMDVVINHTGYATMHEMEEFNYGTVDAAWRDWMPSNGETWHSYHDLFVDYENGDWSSNYWGSDWIRHPDIKGYDVGGDDLTMCVGYLPDLKTESTTELDIPGILVAKWTAEGTLDQKKADLDSFFNETGLSRTVSNYMIFWLVDWVRKFGIDGFRIDTAKHVDQDVLKRFKEMAVEALKEWKAANPDKVMNDDEFWTTGEVWGHGFAKSHYHTDAGFNSIINFDLQGNSLDRNNLDGLFTDYAKVNDDRTWNGLSYLSSHDTELYDRSRLKEVAPGFLLLPGGIQTYYGDETARPLGNYDDEEQNTRSDMNWGNFDDATFNVWTKLGTFRREHAAVGAGTHTKLSESPYTFARDYVDPITGYEDNVIIAINASGNTEFDVADRFPDGHTIVDHYTGNTQTVVDGKVSFTADSEGIILLWDKDYVQVNKPIVSFVTQIEWSEDPISIELSITDKEDPNPILYYTFDENIGTDSLELWNVYSQPFILETTETIRIVGINAEGNLSRVSSKKYSVGPIEPMTLWLYKPSDWAGAYVFYDELSPEGEGVSNVIAWPGAQMIDEGNGWYSYTITAITANVIVFNGGSNTQQTEDLYRTGDGWYQDGSWFDSCPSNCPGPKEPSVSIYMSQIGESDQFNVTISATEDGISYYTTDGSEPSQSSTLYENSFEVSLGEVVKAIAYNSIGASTVETAIAEVQETLTFMWKTTTSNNPTIHIWNVDGVAGDLTTWPGASMQTSTEYSGWVEYTIEGESANVIFNGNGGQSDDLIGISDNDGEFDGIVWYNNGWVSKPDNSESFTIYYKGDYTHIYTWDDNLNADIAWPGTEMQDTDNDGWYEYVVNGNDCINLIFNNSNGQTADLYRCGDGWYSNGSWTNLKGTNTPLSTSNIKTGKVILYPNPADQFVYTTSVSDNSVISFYNAIGNIVYQTKVTSNKVDIGHLKPGLYIVRVNNTTHKIHVK